MDDIAETNTKHEYEPTIEDDVPVPDNNMTKAKVVNRKEFTNS